MEDIKGRSNFIPFIHPQEDSFSATFIAPTLTTCVIKQHFNSNLYIVIYTGILEVCKASYKMTEYTDEAKYSKLKLSQCVL